MTTTINEAATCRCGHARVSHGTPDTHCTMCGPNAAQPVGPLLPDRCVAFEWDDDEQAAAVDRFKAATDRCNFRLHRGFSERPLVDQLHSHAATLAYDLYDPSAPDDTTPRDLLVAGDFILDLAQKVMRDMVDRARESGYTWEQVGATLHISKQAAQQRFGRRK